MTTTTKWGLVATILAPAEEIRRFAAYHLEAGAHRLYLYLDAENPEAFESLKAHPKIRVTTCDEAYWQRLCGKRPQKHQVRQSQNATRAYNRADDVDWLIHMDVDEFIVSDRPVDEVLATLPPAQTITRIRPMEALAGDGTAFKAFIPNGPERAQIVSALYPTYGDYVKGGFLSHLAGKVFVRTGMAEVRLQIHNAFQNDTMIDGPEQQPGIDLAHLHAKSWPEWLAAYRYRLEKGSYRADLAPNRPRDRGGLSMHELFSMIESEGGEPGLRAFFDEVCADTPELRETLKDHGLLRLADLDLDAKVSRHFPS
ncbi:MULTISPECIES: glycosyltransferase family 2 protein [Sulfitobacter]|uniref:glycosyltransferase family 2 protein n=1 Tax=Sulfitobacter TaxID=60136 RepID=UPI0023072EDE|nr:MULTISPECIES: glycosyltransferase family 2 protein [Sulfitobacter]MDF3383749.1 glycosyltransferase family 2 protein [Sulfitobacter sp. Ks11]MDF3387167.1 glycosyltransferase family 2 protein [Sulfitobacter sp. M85]MDF3390587.1 glycosyltransferase family 2 protein [Sulfitobacter sp. Ks16]MDF3401224.1 glycosyltransferase family 2 protein [Sulfitobacter sp. KE39]MDF3404645.1 glycosyltransferase family 2 protein [Sulfitobacter sp. Ks35]